MNELTKDQKRLAWKYFWQQKWEECFPLLIMALCLWYIIGGVLTLSNFLMYLTGEGPYLPIWLWIVYLISLVILGVIAFIIWISNNWEQACSRARRSK